MMREIIREALILSRFVYPEHKSIIIHCYFLCSSLDHITCQSESSLKHSISSYLLEFLVFLQLFQSQTFRNNVFFNYTANCQLLQFFIAVSQTFADTTLFKCSKCPLLFPLTKHLSLSQTMGAEGFLDFWTSQGVFSFTMKLQDVTHLYRQTLFAQHQ